MPNTDARVIFKENLQHYMERQDVNQSNVAAAMGVASSTVSDWYHGNKYPRVNTMQRLATYLDVTISALTTSENYNRTTAIPKASNIFPIPKMIQLPIIGEIACGTPILAEENITGWMDSPDNIHADFCLVCKGDSMVNARIYNGDIVYIRQQPDVENGEIAAVMIQDEATLKRVYKIQGSCIELRAENPTYPILRYEYEKISDIRIIGKAIWFSSPVR